MTKKAILEKHKTINDAELALLTSASDLTCISKEVLQCDNIVKRASPVIHLPNRLKSLSFNNLERENIIKSEIA